jgi:two-component system response regulator ResD
MADRPFFETLPDFRFFSHLYGMVCLAGYKNGNVISSMECWQETDVMKVTKSVLVVDDEARMRQLVRIYLQQDGYQVLEAADGKEALERWREADLVVLDVMMAGLDGWQVLGRIREKSMIPILMLTAKDQVKDRVEGLRLGADDYLVKPFDPEELVARIHSLLRREDYLQRRHEGHEPMEQQIALDGLVIGLETHRVLIHGEEIYFTPKEFELLCFFARHPEKVFHRDVLLEQVWGYDYFGDARTVDTHVKKLREKLNHANWQTYQLKTVWGVGYKLQSLKHEP